MYALISRDSSVGRAEDCRVDKTVILRSVVQIRLAGVYFFQIYVTAAVNSKTHKMKIKMVNNRATLTLSKSFYPSFCCIITRLVLILCDTCITVFPYDCSTFLLTVIDIVLNKQRVLVTIEILFSFIPIVKSMWFWDSQKKYPNVK